MADSGTNGERGSIDDLPWASVFDPAANARALSAIQAEGFRAASQIVDRFIRIVTPEAGPEGAAQPAAAGASAANVVSDLETLTRSWWSMVGRMLLLSTPTGTGPNGATTFDLANDESAGKVALRADIGGVACAEVWLHNRGAENLGEVVLRCSDLLSADGHVVPSNSIVLDPPRVPIPARSSRGVTLNVLTGEGVRPGTYRGTFLVEGHPKLWLPVVLVVGVPAE